MENSGEGTTQAAKPKQGRALTLDIHKMLLLGIILLSILGLIMTFATPWLTKEHEGDEETYYYGDFGGDFEEDIGSDEMDDYYHESANLAVIGFILLAVCGTILYLQSIGKSVPFIPRRAGYSNQSDARPKPLGQYVMLAAFIPTTFVLLAGARFVGLVNMFNSYSYTFESSEPGEGIEEEIFGTPAGTIILVLGLLSLLILLFLLLKELRFSGFKMRISNLWSKQNYTDKISMFALIFITLSIVGIFTMPILSFLDIESKQHYSQEGIEGFEGYEWSSESYISLNDGLIYTLGETGAGGKVDDIFEDISGKLGLISFALWVMLVLSIMVFMGLFMFTSGGFPKRAHTMLSAGSLVLIFSIVTILFFGLILGDVGRLDEEYGKMADSLSDEHTSWSVENNANFGSNFLPLICGAILFIASIPYLLAVYPVSIAMAIGKVPPEAMPAPVAAEPGIEPPVEAPRPPSKVPAKPVMAIVAIVIVVILIVVMLPLLQGGEEEKEKGKGGEGEEVVIPDDYNTMIDDNLQRGSHVAPFVPDPRGEAEGVTYKLYPVLIEYNITEIVIESSGDPGSPPRADGGDRNDIDIYLYRPGTDAEGNQADTDPDYEGATPYIDERITITRSTLEWGNWTLRVDCFTGDNVQYTIDIQVIYDRGNETEEGNDGGRLNLKENDMSHLDNNFDLFHTLLRKTVIL